MVKIVAVGDIMPGGLLSQSSDACVNEEVLNILKSGDICVGTLECALGNSPTYDPEKVADRGNVIYAQDDDIRRLQELGVNIVSLANNHFFDLGIEGAKHTMALLDRVAINHVGAGMNLAEASKPTVIEQNGETIAFLAFCDTVYSHVYWCTYAEENSPGVNPMKPEHVKQTIKDAASVYDYVVVLAHWGTEHTFRPNLDTDRMARLMLDAGACLVLGSHPHRIQPVVNFRRGSVAYSMGNFLFPERLIAPPKITWYPQGPIDYSSLPVTDGYPLVDTVTLKTLPYWARVGQIVISILKKNKAKSSWKYSFLGKSNQISLLDESRTSIAEKHIYWQSILIRLNLYYPGNLIKAFARKLKSIKR